MTLACTIDATGISAPNYATILASLTASAQTIFGADAYLEPDSQDGQLIAIVALAVSDMNSAAIATYNDFSPATAQGNGLSSVVKTNGITREISSASQVLQQIIGTVGTMITNGYVVDGNNVQWNLPATVVVPSEGLIVVTATCAVQGAITAAPGSIAAIGTPTYGWLSTTNTSSATPGEPVETDGLLRQRQAVSTSQPAQTVLEALEGDIAALPGVTRFIVYENDTDTTNSNGQPAHSIASVVDGGDAQQIAQTIYKGKAPGASTEGTTSETVVDPQGIPRVIKFYAPTDVPITVSVTILALQGYTSAIGVAIQAAIVGAINALAIGEDVYLGRLYLPANLSGGLTSLTFDIMSIQISRDGNALAASNVNIAYIEAATCATVNVTITVTT
jgi:uncharacterized phage protein gp47/JayE